MAPACPACGELLEAVSAGQGACPRCLASFTAREVTVGDDAFRASTHLVLEELETPAPPDVDETSSETGLALRLVHQPHPSTSWKGPLAGLFALLGACLMALSVPLILDEHFVAAFLFGWFGTSSCIVGLVARHRARLPPPRREHHLLAGPDALELSGSRPLSQIDKLEVETHRGGTRADLVVRHRQYRERTVLLRDLPVATAHWIARRLRRALHPSSR